MATVKIGTTVEYVSTEGATKVGLVVATADTLKEGTSLSEAYPLSDEQVNLVVFSASGSHYPRYQVPSLAFVEQAKAQGNTDYAEGGYWKPIA